MRTTKLIFVITLGATAVLLFASDAAWAQCAMCRTALLKSPEGQRLARGFNTGIFFLLGSPFLVGGAIAFAVFRRRLGTWFERATRLGARTARKLTALTEGSKL